MSDGGATLLEERVQGFDRRSPIGQLPDVDEDVYRFLATMQLVTPVGPRTLAHAPSIDPALADHLVGRSALLRRLAARAPEVVRGPIDMFRQYWVATGRPDHLPPRERVPAPDAFVDAREATTPS